MADPQEPEPMSRTLMIGHAVGLPVGLLCLVFLPVGSIRWWPGWIFIVVLVLSFGSSALVLARVNPIIYRARSRFQPGTKRWDKALLAVILPAMVAIIPVGTFDAGRTHWSVVPGWLVGTGYTALVAGIAIAAWAQAVNPYFEPGVRIQSERQQRVIDTGPYRFARHPGYILAMLIFVGMALALGSLWALAPAALASAFLIVRTAFEDRLLRRELSGYEAYSHRVRWRLFPGIW